MEPPLKRQKTENYAQSIDLKNKTLDPILLLPPEISLQILGYLNGKELAGCQLVSKTWKQLASDHTLLVKPSQLKMRFGEELFLFGPEEWKKHFGEIGEVPPFPKNIMQILAKGCPHWPEKKVYQTHMLVLIPKTVNEEALTLNTLGELVKKPKVGNKTQYRYIRDELIEEHGKTPLEESTWVLMTKDVLEGSRGKTRTDQLALASEKPGYLAPKLLEAAICIFMKYVVSGERLFYTDKEPWTYTCCLEQTAGWRKLVVGGFSPAGLYASASSHYGSLKLVGVAALRKFKGPWAL